MNIIDQSSYGHRQGGLLRVLAMSCLLLLFMGCRADDPQGGKLDLDPPPDGDPWFPDGPVNCSNTVPLPAPIFNPPPPASTSYGLQPFRGKSTGAAKLYAQLGSATTKPVTVSSDGTFCIEVQLLLDSPNVVTFTPLDINGCPGISTKQTITHKSVPKIDAGMPTIQNVAKGQPVSELNMDSSSQLSYVVDGDSSSYAKFSFFDSGSSNAWIMVDLGKSYTVSKLYVRYPSSVSNDYAKEYQILVSAKAAPVTPDPSEVTDWKSLKHETNGDATAQLIPISPESVRWVALLLYENGSTYLWETFLISELEVWGQDPNAQPPPPPDSCQ